MPEVSFVCFVLHQQLCISVSIKLSVKDSLTMANKTWLQQVEMNISYHIPQLWPDIIILARFNNHFQIQQMWPDLTNWQIDIFCDMSGYYNFQSVQSLQWDRKYERAKKQEERHKEPRLNWNLSIWQWLVKGGLCNSFVVLQRPH